MSKYFRLGKSYNIKETGKSPQSIEGFMGDIQKDILPFEGPIEFEFNLPIPKLQKGARLTTLLSVVMFSGRYFAFGDEFIDFLKDFNIGEYQHWPIDVIQNKKIVKGYNLFYLATTRQREYIDYANSSFYVGSIRDYKFVGDDVRVSNYEEFLKIKNELRDKKLFLKYSKLVINLTNAEEDIFRFVNSFEGGYYVSNRLRQAIEDNQFTGFAFDEIENNNKIEVLY